MKYKKSPENTDFSLISNSTRNIARIMKPYHIKISAQSLSLGLIGQLLKTKNYSQLNKLINHLEEFPENVEKFIPELETIMTKASDLEKIGFSFEFPRFSYEQGVRTLKFVFPLIPLMVPIIQHFL